MSAGERPSRPTPADIRAAAGKTVPDVIAPGLAVLFVGINPGLYTAAVGHHFARPGNRFWPALHLGGLTPRELSPFEEQELLAYGYGITNIAPRATATAAELAPAELREGGQRLAEKVAQYGPRTVAVLGVTAYRTAFGQLQAQVGPQVQALAGVPTWILPNPSGLNAHYSLADLADWFRRLAAAAG